MNPSEPLRTTDVDVDVEFHIDLGRLRETYLTLVRKTLPAAAAAATPAWPIRLDHCFMRVVLDNLLGRCWYDVLDRRSPAYRQLTAEQLTAAIELARSMADDRGRVVELNDRSLALRKHRARHAAEESKNKI